MRLVADTGWGFTDCGFGEREDVPLGPEQKREHLFAFWKTKVWQLLFQIGQTWPTIERPHLGLKVVTLPD